MPTSRLDYLAPCRSSLRREAGDTWLVQLRQRGGHRLWRGGPHALHHMEGRRWHIAGHHLWEGHWVHRLGWELGHSRVNGQGSHTLWGHSQQRDGSGCHIWHNGPAWHGQRCPSRMGQLDRLQ